MNRSPLLLAVALGLAAVSSAQMPWPMERHDRWGSGYTPIGPNTQSLKATIGNVLVFGF